MKQKIKLFDPHVDDSEKNMITPISIIDALIAQVKEQVVVEDLRSWFVTSFGMH